MGLSDFKTRRNKIKIAMAWSLVYIVSMIAVWLSLGEALIDKIEKTYNLGAIDLPMSTKYIVITVIGSIVVFILSMINYKRIDKKERSINSSDLELKFQRRLIDNLLESAVGFVLMLDKDLNIKGTTENIKEMIEFEKEELLSKPLYTVIHYDYIQQIKEGIKDREFYEIEMQIDSKYGKKLELFGRIKRDTHTTDSEISYTFVLYDISTKKSLQERISYMDSYDPLTDLPNRNYTERVFISLQTHMNRSNNLAALLYIDIDDFAFINETKGHRAGDYLLIDMANRIKSLMKETDIVSRITQDEFVIIFTAEKSLEDIDKRVREVVKETKLEWEFDEDEYIVSTTIGVSLYPKDGKDFITLLRNASLALECAKESSRASYEYYSKEQTCSTIKDLTVVSDIKYALEAGHFQMFYQPIHDMETCDFQNAESLIRWFHPSKGYISPAHFIPIAERAGMIDDIGEFTLEEVFKQKSQWKKQGYKMEKVSINISAISFSKENFSDYIIEKLHRYDLRGDELVLELTESIFSTHKNKIKKNIDELRAVGVEISMDDFGTGYSSLARLKDLQIDYLKLDRAFIVSLLEENGQEIIKPLISLAKALGKNVVAEGIETQEQFDILKKLGSEYGQGYLLSRPMPAEKLTELLEKNDPQTD